MVPNPALDAAAVSAATQWVVFACGDHLFGLPLHRTREILPPRPITRLPGCGPEVAGLAGIRGRVITVFDFGVLLAGRAAAQHDEHRMLVVVVQGKRVAVLVDEIIAVSRESSGVLPLDANALRPYDIDRDDIVGVGAHEEQPFLALDPDRILARLLT
ncbi:MAG TPA: chemotaxis protein CheW [Longimicrobiales bacterium]